MATVLTVDRSRAKAQSRNANLHKGSVPHPKVKDILHEQPRQNGERCNGLDQFALDVDARGAIGGEVHVEGVASLAWARDGPLKGCCSASRNGI